MRPGECAGELLRRLAAMPFLDRLEMAAVSGWSRGAVYEGAGRLERAGLAGSLPHASELIPPTRRYHLTAEGLHRLAREEGMTVDELLLAYPVSEQWRRVLLERLDAVAVIYRVASAVSTFAHPIRFRWFRAMPMDAVITLPGGRTVAVVRQGLTADRTAFAKRLWRLREGPQPAATLLLMPDEVRLRHARKLLTGAPPIAYLALERHAASAGAGAAIWRTPAGAALLDLRTLLDHTGPPRPWPGEAPPVRPSLPTDPDAEQGGPDWLLPVLLKPVEKRALDLLSDWPWIAPAHLGALLGLKRSRLSEVVGRLTAMDLALEARAEGHRRLVLSDRGLPVLARRDRASVGGARKRWSAAPRNPHASAGWRNVTGSRSRQLLRNAEHTAAVHGFIAALARQARSRSREIIQLDPPRRASRYFRHAGRLRSVHPDAFGVLHRDGAVWPFFLEWERRAVRPVTMAARLAPYLRYYSSHRPTDDHGAQPAVLVVFDDDIAQTHFLRVAQTEMAQAGVEIPLLVSHRELVEREGPLGRAWRAPGVPEPLHVFTSR